MERIREEIGVRQNERPITNLSVRVREKEAVGLNQALNMSF